MFSLIHVIITNNHFISTFPSLCAYYNIKCIRGIEYAHTVLFVFSHKVTMESRILTKPDFLSIPFEEMFGMYDTKHIGTKRQSAYSSVIPIVWWSKIFLTYTVHCNTTLAQWLLPTSNAFLFLLILIAVAKRSKISGMTWFQV